MANFLPNDNTDPRIDIIWAQKQMTESFKTSQSWCLFRGNISQTPSVPADKDADEGVHLSREGTMKYLAVNHLSALSYLQPAMPQQWIILQLFSSLEKKVNYSYVLSLS